MSTTLHNPDEASLDSSVAALLDQLETSETVSPSPAEGGEALPPAPSPTERQDQEFRDPQASIESLDAALAGLAANLLGREGVIDPEPQAFNPPMPAVAALQPEIYRSRPVPQALPAVDPLVEQSDPPPSAPPEVPPPAPEVVAPRAPSGLERLAAAAGERAVAEVHRGLTRLAAPLEPRPPIVKTMVGIAAGFNLALAAVVWLCIAFVQPDVAGAPRPGGHGSSPPPPPLPRLPPPPPAKAAGNKSSAQAGAKKNAVKKPAKSGGH
jgi:hypothetical protein